MTNLTGLAARHAGRPLLLTPRAALELANRVRAVDAEAAVRPGRFSALIRRLAGLDQRPMAMDDDEDYVPVPLEARLAYAPLYAGEPDDVGYCWTLKDGVALMQIDKPLLDRGEIFCGEVYHGYDTLLRGLREAQADDRVKAIFIREATPGGVVATGLPALAEHMRETSARAGGKPIHVYADMACSAGYWIASAADRIVSGRVGLVGSIGAVIVHENWSGALAKAGVEITPIQFGEAKTDGAWFAALSDRARADLQAEIDQCGRDFVADVVAGRPQLSPEEVLATQAAVFMGHHDEPERSALALKLVDAVASEEAAFSELRDQVAGGSPTVTVPGSPATAGSARDRASASPAKEAPVAKTPKAGGKPSATSQNAKAVAAAQAAVRKAQADLARIQAQAAEEAPADDEDIEDSPDASTEGEDETAPDAVEGDEDEVGGEDDQTEAEKISASPEAASNPAAAMAAIRTGQTYEQFKASAAAFGSGGGRRQLESTLKDSPRLGADASSSGAGKVTAGLDPRAIYARRAERARSGGAKA